MEQRRRRNELIIGFVALSLLAGVALSASPTQAATGNGPYLAEPAWDRKLPAATRFLILTNWNKEAVLDKETGLVWERSPDPDPVSWLVALSACLNKTTGNRKGWRLPSIPELASLIDPSVANPGPTLPPGHPFLTALAALYWSATTNASVPTSAWHVEFFDGGHVEPNDKAGGLRVWCVRGGMNADAY